VKNFIKWLADDDTGVVHCVVLALMTLLCAGAFAVMPIFVSIAQGNARPLLTWVVVPVAVLVYMYLVRDKENGE
jgi:hypothetical protein